MSVQLVTFSLLLNCLLTSSWLAELGKNNKIQWFQSMDLEGWKWIEEIAMKGRKKKGLYWEKKIEMLCSQLYISKLGSEFICEYNFETN